MACPGAAAALLAAALFFVLALVLALVLAAAARRRRRRARGPAPSRPAAVGGGGDDFPYWAAALPPPEAMFEALRAEELGAGPGGPAGAPPVLTRRYPRDYLRADAVSNHFTERARVDCRSGRRPTPREAWARLRRRPGVRALPPAAQREAVYAATRECNIFNPAFARWVLERVGGRGARVLDPSAGWGDRLVGALAAGAGCYHGFDPNPRLQEGYREIVRRLGGGRHGAFRVAEAPFEEAAPPPGWYDVAFTSPPYFSYEEYVPPGGAGEGAQSAARHPRFEDWAARMYRPYLANAFRAVRPGGWVVLYIEDVALGGRRFPLRALTREVLEGLGAEPAGEFGLRVVPDGGPPPGGPPPRTRLALAWRKPGPPRARRRPGSPAAAEKRAGAG